MCLVEIDIFGNEDQKKFGTISTLNLWYVFMVIFMFMAKQSEWRTLVSRSFVRMYTSYFLFINKQEPRVKGKQTWIQILDLTFTDHVTVGKFPNLSCFISSSLKWVAQILPSKKCLLYR